MRYFLVGAIGFKNGNIVKTILRSIADSDIPTHRQCIEDTKAANEDCKEISIVSLSELSKGDFEKFTSEI